MLKIGDGKEQTMSSLMIVEVPSYTSEFKGIREVQELVRCGECKYWKSTVQMPNGTEVKCLYGRKADDFCSYGEREGE